MNKAELEQQIHVVCRMRRLSIHTERTYAEWIRRFGRFVQSCPQLSREEKLRSWLEQMAPHCSASTQNQALNAVVFLYRDVLQEPLGELGKWARAKKPEQDPYRELKEAHAAGRIIKCRGNASREWLPLQLEPVWNLPVSAYYIEPEPETFEAHGKMWFRHTPGDPMPCDGDAVVEFIIGNGLVGGKGKAIGLHWWVKNGGRLADPHLLIGWRYADEAPKAKNPHPEICGRLDCQVAVTHYEAEHPECSAHAQIEQDPSPQGSKWMGHPKGNDSTPTDNDAWESLLHTNATLGREVSRLRAEVDSLNAKLNAVREVLK